MGTPQTQDTPSDADLAALRRERVAAHRRLLAWSFALEEHEANALAASLPHQRIAREAGFASGPVVA
jgi:hypothetical protein